MSDNYPRARRRRGEAVTLRVLFLEIGRALNMQAQLVTVIDSRRWASRSCPGSRTSPKKRARSEARPARLRPVRCGAKAEADPDELPEGWVIFDDGDAMPHLCPACRESYRAWLKEGRVRDEVPQVFPDGDGSWER